MWNPVVVVYMRTDLCENRVSLKKKLKTDNLNGSYQPKKIILYYIYMRTDEVLITSWENRNRSVLTKKWEPPNTGLEFPFLMGESPKFQNSLVIGQSKRPINPTKIIINNNNNKIEFWGFLELIELPIRLYITLHCPPQFVPRPLVRAKIVEEILGSQ